LDNSRVDNLKKFVSWFEDNISGDEKGEGQIFFDRLFQAFGNPGVKEVGAVCEERVKKKKGTTGFADLVWRPRVIIELKKRGEPLNKHYEQAFEYWLTLVPNRPSYMILCNFDEFWIYDLNIQLNDPVHKLKTVDLPTRWGALSFLFPTPEEPVFENNNVEVTEQAAKIIGSMFLSLTKRGVESEAAQKFLLQLVVALFAEDVNLIPKYTLHKILKEAVKNPVTQAELTDLFLAMSNELPSKKPSKYKEIEYFNGGIFNEVKAFELTFDEIDLLYEASKQDWSKVRPSIFGGIFESSMDQDTRHGHGIHYTSELDIQKIIWPTIIKPFKARIKKSKTKKELKSILEDVRNFKVLDPACGSGNFLYLAFRELTRLEIELMEEIDNSFNPNQMRFGMISPKNFYGLDTNKFGLELAKVSLSIGRKLAADEFNILEKVTPFENLDKNFLHQDALLSPWPEVDAIIGNPPFLSSKYMKVEMPEEYVNEVRKTFKDVPGRADYCVYWFKKAHDHLKAGQRAGLVGTNTIKQNYSRIGGLDYIVNNGGTITEAVGTQVWSGDASVHVSIVNWCKCEVPLKKKLYIQDGDRIDSPWEVYELDFINSSLTNRLSVAEAKVLKSSRKPKKCYQGQSPGSEGFYISKEEYASLISMNENNKDVLYPFLVGRDLLSKIGKPKRYIIDFAKMGILDARFYKEPFNIIEKKVLPLVKDRADKEKKKTKKEGARSNQLKKWWMHWRPREDLLKSISSLSRYIVISRVTKRPIFQFISNEIHPGDALIAFTFEDNYSFGVLQSTFHLEWFREKCSTLKGDWRYTGDTIFDTFPWPQSPSLKDVENVSRSVNELLEVRKKIMLKNDWGLKDLYQTLELPGDSILKNAHKNLDEAVRKCYGFKKGDVLQNLLDLNFEISKNEELGLGVQSPGMPDCVKSVSGFIYDDCVKM